MLLMIYFPKEERSQTRFWMPVGRQLKIIRNPHRGLWGSPSLSMSWTLLKRTTSMRRWWSWSGTSTSTTRRSTKTRARSARGCSGEVSAQVAPCHRELWQDCQVCCSQEGGLWNIHILSNSHHNLSPGELKTLTEKFNPQALDKLDSELKKASASLREKQLVYDEANSNLKVL